VEAKGAVVFFGDAVENPALFGDPGEIMVKI